LNLSECLPLTHSILPLGTPPNNCNNIFLPINIETADCTSLFKLCVENLPLGRQRRYYQSVCSIQYQYHQRLPRTF